MVIKMFSHWTDLTEVVRTDTGQGYFCATSVEFETWSKPWLPDCHGSSRCMWLTFSSKQDPDLLEAKMPSGWNTWTAGNEDTLPKTNIAPEIRPLEKEIPIGNLHFWVLC